MSRNRRPAFTLIELLVVVGVIAILAAILFPVFAQAREKARQATCTANMKQLGQMMMMYVNGVGPNIPDNDDVTPPTGCYSMPRYRHQGGVNLTFVDGHVKWMRKGSLRWCRHISIAEPGPTCLP